MGGLAFPLTSDAASQLEGFQNGTVALVLLSIQAEQVVLRSAAATATTAHLAAALPADEPCYALFRWPHEHEGMMQSRQLCRPTPLPLASLLFLFAGGLRDWSGPRRRPGCDHLLLQLPRGLASEAQDVARLF